jgi:hypothetical protein
MLVALGILRILYSLLTPNSARNPILLHLVIAQTGVGTAFVLQQSSQSSQVSTLISTAVLYPFLWDCLEQRYICVIVVPEVSGPGGDSSPT